MPLPSAWTKLNLSQTKYFFPDKISFIPDKNFCPKLKKYKFACEMVGKGLFSQVQIFSTAKIVFCWNNCSGYSQEKCFKCNLVFPKLSRLKKGQRVKGFWSQGRKKGTKGKVFEAEAVGRGWEMFPRFPFFYRGFKMFTSCPSFFNQDALG